MATKDQILATVDASYALMVPGFTANQTQYAIGPKGNYWQGLQTHSVLPADGVATAPDSLDHYPTDQPDSWTSVSMAAVLPPTMPMAIVVDVYESPKGKGYVDTLRVKIGADVWSRSIGYGPEQMTVDWQIEPHNGVSLGGSI